MVKVATDKSRSGLVCTGAVWASKMVQSPSENDKLRQQAGWNWVELDAHHDPMITDPQAVSTFLATV